MEINMLYLKKGASLAKGLTVIIDVFRAFSLECYIMAAGAKKIIPVADKDEAYELKKANPEYILIGERHGIKLEGFDYGNSPSQIKNVDFKNKTIIHTTSSGTQGLAGAVNADNVITGSLVNAKAIADYIIKCNAKIVSLVSMGWEGIYNTKEDILCAEYIRALLKGEESDVLTGIENLKQTDGARFFDESQQESCPTEDFYLCTDINKFNFVLKYNGQFIEKINV